MRTVFVDTSALYALTVPDDADHGAAARVLRAVRGVRLVTHNYIVVETLALVQHRRGTAALRRLTDGILPIVRTDWIQRDLHDRALAALVAAGGRKLSFVDRVSFAFMRERAIEVAFAFDQDFEREGFEVVSGG